MLGRHHLSLTVLTVAAVVAPIILTYPVLIGLLLVGASIGGLLPDSDSHDATIFHTNVSGLSSDTQSLVRTVSILFPVFGYTAKYLIHKPAIHVYNTAFSNHVFTEKHRGFMHSFLGIGTTMIFLGVYITTAIAALQLYSNETLVTVAAPYILIFIVGVGVGEFLHIVEDSCTKTGIKWNYPFHEWKIKGRITTTNDKSDTWTQSTFTILLGLITVIGIYAGIYGISPVLVTLIMVIGVIVLWSVFAIVVAQCRVTT